MNSIFESTKKPMRFTICKWWILLVYYATILDEFVSKIDDIISL